MIRKPRRNPTAPGASSPALVPWQLARRSRSPRSPRQAATPPTVVVRALPNLAPLLHQPPPLRGWRPPVLPLTPPSHLAPLLHQPPPPLRRWRPPARRSKTASACSAASATSRSWRACSSPPTSAARATATPSPRSTVPLGPASSDASSTPVRGLEARLVVVWWGGQWLIRILLCGRRVRESGGREGGGARGIPAARRHRARRARARPGGCGRRGGRFHCAPSRRGYHEIVRNLLSVLLMLHTQYYSSTRETFLLFCNRFESVKSRGQPIHVCLCYIVYRTDPAITEECFELLSLIAIASEDGAYKFCEPGVVDMIFLQILSLTDGIKFS